MVSGNQITCNLPLFGVMGGVWDVEVSNPDAQTATIVNRFEVTVDCIKCDMNGDGLVDGSDIQRFVDILMGDAGYPFEHCSGDIALVRDGLIGLEDVEAFAECMLSGGCL